MTEEDRERLATLRAEHLRQAELLRRQLECDAVARVNSYGAKCSKPGRHDGCHEAEIKLAPPVSAEPTVFWIEWYDHGEDQR